MSDVEKLTAQFTALNAECEKIEKDITALDRKIEDAALDAETGGNRKAYDKLAAERDELTATLHRKRNAAMGLQAKVSEAKVAEHDAQREQRQRVATAIIAKRQKVAETAQEAIKVLAGCHVDMFDLTRDASDEFRTTLGTRLNGVVVNIGEWLNMLEVELARVSSPGPLPPSHVPPALPGSRDFIFGGGAAKTPTLSEAMKAANEELLRRVTAAPVPVPVQKPKGDKPTPTAAPIETPTTPRIDGTQIVRPRVRMA